MIAHATTYASQGTLLELDRVSLTLGGTVILRDLSGRIEDIPNHGQVVALLGPSGIGKTQTARIIAGLQVPTSGQVLVTPAAVPVRRGMVGYVFQQSTLFEHRTVLGNLLRAAGRKNGTTPAMQQAQALAMLERFGLTDHAQHYPAQLSGGQRQRVAIAQQLACSEHLLIMDEPLASLDPIMVDTVCALITEVAEADELNSVLVLTHDIRSALKVADTLWLLGRDRDPSGQVIPGAKIMGTYDLAAMGLAWHPEVSRTPEFVALERDIRDRFKTL